jgi:hypothetical protein
MSFARDGYYYNQQLKTYILQFMAIFTDLQVQIGKWNTEDERLISVPIHYGSQDRVVASILAENTQNKPLRLPAMSAYLRNMTYNPARAVGTGFERRQSYVPVGGLVPNDINVVYQRRPVPYEIDMDLSIYASNTDQLFQIFEQILPIFDPILQIQVTDSLFDMKKITTVELTGIQVETNYPISTDRRIIQSTLSFKLPIFIDTPAEVRKNYVNKIFMRVGAVSTDSTDEFDIIGDLNSQGIAYELIQDGSSVSLG